MSVPRNSPSCGVCGLKQVRNGKTSSGRTRWRCRSCGFSSTQSRADISRKAELDHFLTWLLDERKPEDLASSARTFRRKTRWCWRIEVPPPVPDGVVHDVVILDGTYFQSWCLLIATDGRHVIDWQWCDREKKIAWQQILNRWPAPMMAVIDGGSGLHSALAETWPDTRIQRCYFHIFQVVRRHHTLKPRLEPGKEILALTRALMKVSTLDEAVAWLVEYQKWETRWDGLLRLRSYARNNALRPANVPMDRTWWYTHQSLRKTRSSMRKLIREDHLFTWLDPELQDRALTEGPLARTTSSLEGGPNRALKELFRRHRGLPVEHARRAAEWKLDSLTSHPRDPWTLVRPEHYNPPPRQPSQPHDEPIGPTMGTNFSWEDGNGLQKGWGGRTGH